MAETHLERFLGTTLPARMPSSPPGSELVWHPYNLGNFIIIPKPEFDLNYEILRGSLYFSPQFKVTIRREQVVILCPAIILH